VSASSTEDYEVTLATLRNLVDRTLEIDAAMDHPRNDHAQGYVKAIRDVKAILGKHGRPAHEPVHFGGQW
jgi:hypothetical protein